ncbi:Protein PIN-LIKES 3 [Hirschfeldia incana]|nr:Protein PIN-LIKES 3 [Hirschfeldia incana]KAJ0256526.1 Protein PIN-LIKES 3 [Hirschfeldia incana]
MMKLLHLFITSSKPVVEILMITSVGFYMALDGVNLLGPDARKYLNDIVFYVFNPSLVGSRLADSVTYESLVKMWFMPVNLLLTFIIGSLLGWIVILITKPPPHLRGLIVGCCAAGNLGNMPLIIIPAVCKDKEGPFGDPENCHKYGMGYVAFSMSIGAVYIWTYVYNLMRVLSNSPIEVQPSTESSYKYNSCKVPLISSKEEEEGEDNHKVGRWDRFKRRMVSLSEKVNLSTIFAPTTIAAIIALLIGLITPLRELIIGSVAPLGVLQDSVTLVGDGAIPATTLIIGSNLLKGMRSSGMKKSSIAGVLVARYILLPISGVLIVRGAYRLDLITSEPLYQFVLLIQYAVPPAMSLGTITQLFGTGESECSVIMLWAYGLGSVSLTAWPTFFMWLVA